MKTTTKHTTKYLEGELVQYTGKTELLHGQTAYELIYLEGYRKGQTRWTYRAHDHC